MVQQDPVSQYLRPVEQVTREGLSGDYYNALIVPIMRYRDFGLGVEGAAQYIREYPISRYTERFPPDQYEGVITTFNRQAVNRLDQIADELNMRARAGTLSDELYRSLHSEACSLVFGPERKEMFE